MAVTMSATQEARKSLSRFSGTFSRETEELVAVVDTSKILSEVLAAKKV